MRLQNAGLVDRWVDEITLKYGTYFDEELSGKAFYVLTMSHVQGAFYLLLLGHVLSIVFFFAETVTRCWNKFNLRKNQCDKRHKRCITYDVSYNKRRRIRVMDHYF